MLRFLRNIVDVEVKGVERPQLQLPSPLKDLRAFSEEKNKDVYEIAAPHEMYRFFHALDIWLFEQVKYGVVGASGCGAIYPGRYVVDTKNKIQYSIWQPNVKVLSGIVTFTDLTTGSSKTIGILNSYGRWSGPGGDGWDQLHYLVGGVLTFPSTSNLGALLAVYSDPPKIPFKESWQVPTFPTDSPEVKFPMSSVFSFSRMLPRPLSVLTFTVDVADTSPKTLRVSVWDADRTPIDSKTVTLEGSVSYNVRATVRRLPSSGYIEVSAVNVPEPGFTISDVRLL